MTSRANCNSTNTADGRPCRNSADSCPFPSHRQATRVARTAGAGAARAAASGTLRSELPDSQARGAPLAYPVGSTGYAASGVRFRRSVADTAARLRLPTNSVAHDYWIVRGLHGIHRELDPHGAIVFPPIKPRTPDRRIGVWGFGGGTALSAAWRITERYSEDIDGLLFLDSSDLSKNAIERACGKVARAVCDACESVHHETHGRNVKVTRIDLDGHPDYLKVETVPQHGLDAAVEPRVVHSFIGQHADGDLLEEFPELGGFTVPCVRPMITAINKLDALNRRAARDDLEGLVTRGRDLYDLWAIAQHQQHTDDVRNSVADLWQAAAGQLREPVERPGGGYAQSTAFLPDSTANNALRDGYTQAIEAAVWGQMPTFEEAIEAARSLDQA